MRGRAVGVAEEWCPVVQVFILVQSRSSSLYNDLRERARRLKLPAKYRLRMRVNLRWHRRISRRAQPPHSGECILLRASISDAPVVFPKVFCQTERSDVERGWLRMSLWRQVRARRAISASRLSTMYRPTRTRGVVPAKRCQVDAVVEVPALVSGWYSLSFSPLRPGKAVFVTSRRFRAGEDAGSGAELPRTLKASTSRSSQG